mmetsp:Transcript_11009/g.29164  ORF Transcript_11009/g.29164 Transcript_11009/m.29164 type:complete len:142 (+) Transcript_11009:618-1043(+)
MTGNIQKMAEAVWNQRTKKGGLKPKERRAALLLVCVWSCYVIGGVCGASLAGLSDWSLAPAATIYFSGMLSMQTERPKPPPVVDATPAKGEVAAGAKAIGGAPAPTTTSSTSDGGPAVTVEVRNEQPPTTPATTEAVSKAN